MAAERRLLSGAEAVFSASLSAGVPYSLEVATYGNYLSSFDIIIGYDEGLASVLSQGNVWIAAGVGAAAVAGVAVLAVVKKKKNTAVSSNEE